MFKDDKFGQMGFGFKVSFSFFTVCFLAVPPSRRKTPPLCTFW